MSGVAAPGRTVGTLLGRVIDRFYLKPIVAAVIVWQLVSLSGTIPRQTLPSPAAVAEAFYHLAVDGPLFAAAGVTLYRVIGAFAIAILAGVLVGLLMSQFTSVGWFFDPIVSVAFPIPKVTLVPVYTLWFGFGSVAATALAATSAFFPVVIGTHNGTKAVDRELVWSARSMGLSRLETSTRIVLPAALPAIMNGVQISLFLSFVVVIVAEMVMAGSGLGHLIVEAVRTFRTADAIAALVLVSILGVVIDRLFRRVRSRLLWWTE